MSFMHIISSIAAGGLLVYLIAVLLSPEYFS